MENPIYVFVYGTLKRDRHNHHMMATAQYGKAVYEGQAVTVEKYPLLVAGLPFLFNNPGVGHNVEGEVYAVDEERLARLDRFEGHPRLYRRETIMVTCHGEQRECQAYFYTETYDPRREAQLVAKF